MTDSALKSSVVSLRINPKQKQRLDALTQKTGRSSAFYLRQALDAHLDHLEYIYDLQAEAEAARRGELSTISLTELETECDVDD